MSSGFVSLGVSVLGLLVVLLGAMGMLFADRIVERQQQRGAAMTEYEEVDTDEQILVTRISGGFFVLVGLWIVLGLPGL